MHIHYSIYTQKRENRGQRGYSSKMQNTVHGLTWCLLSNYRTLLDYLLLATHNFNNRRVVSHRELIEFLHSIASSKASCFLKFLWSGSGGQTGALSFHLRQTLIQELNIGLLEVPPLVGHHLTFTIYTLPST